MLPHRNSEWIIKRLEDNGLEMLTGALKTKKEKLKQKELILKIEIASADRLVINKVV